MTAVGSESAADLVRAKAVLLDPGPGKRRLGPEALRTALVDLHDFWLASRCAAIGLTDRAALVAVGALGRRELAPYSDLDLVLLHDGRKDVDRLAEELWYPLWNSGIGLDHSVRTPGQAVQVAATDLRAAFGLLEARHLAGDPELSEKVGSAVRQAWRAGIRGRYEEIAEGAHERWRKSGDVAHRVEPDLKSGHGGLRDVQLIDALAAAQLVDRPSRDVLDGRELLLNVRTELHRMAGRARDVLRAQDADEVAASLDIADRFELARALSGAARSVAFAAEVGLRQARNALPRRGLAALRRPPVRRPLDSGVVEHGGEVALARDATAARDPALVLRVAATAARTGLPVAAGTLHRLADTAPELREPWPRAARGELLSLLGTGRPLVDVVESLDRTGLWGRLFPEWGAVRDLPPRDRAHVWTVDRHLVETCAQAARLTTQVARPDLLLISSLLHDIGKGRGGDHSVVGESLAVQIGRRLGFADAGRRGPRRRGAPPPAAAAHGHPARPGGPGDGGPGRRDAGAGRARGGRAPARPARRARRGRLARHRPGRVEPVEAGADRRPRRPVPRAVGGGGVARAHRAVDGGDRDGGRGGGRGTSAAAPGDGRPGDGHRRAAEAPHRRARRGRGRARAALAGGARGRGPVRGRRVPRRHGVPLHRDARASAASPTRRCCARTWRACSTAASRSTRRWRARSGTTRPRRRPANRPPRPACSGSTTRPPARSSWSCAARTGSGCCTGSRPRWPAATSACGGRGSPRSGRRSWTRSASTPTTARSRLPQRRLVEQAVLAAAR